MTRPTVTYQPNLRGRPVGEWVFVLHAAGHSQRLRTTELQALYRDCDTALNDARKAAS